MTWLEGEATTIALCWRIERRDGVTIGLTAHDRDLVIDGVIHRASPGMIPSAIVRQVALAADTMDVAGALTSEAIDARDLLDGRWDGARVMLFAVDWSGETAGRVELGEGTIGAVEMADGRFSAELAGPGATLGRAAVEETSAGCRATLGDARCRVAMAGRRRFARVTAAEGAVVTVDALEPVANAYGGGAIRWLEGKNGGTVQSIALSAGATLALAMPPVRTVAAGVLVELVEGCDRTLATCAGRFGNAANFRGEPHLPGMDLLTRWPRGLIGTRFRLHGRDPATGIDCVGLAALALGLEEVPTGYPLRGGDAARWGAAIDARLRRVADDWAAGDLMLMATGPGQLHLGIWTGGGLVHADAGLGRVVERPGVPPWPVLGVWRRG